MALRWIESFDNMGTSGATVLLTKYDSSRSSASAMTVSTTQARTGACSCSAQTSTTGLNTNALGMSGATFCTGFAFYVPSATFSAGPTGNGYIFKITEEDATIHLQLAIDSTGHLKVYRNTTLLDTSSSTLTFNTWYYIEFKGLISDTVGTWDVHVDASATGWPTGTGDTQNGGTGQPNRAAILGAYSGSFACFIDDWYVLDGSGAANNDFLGIKNVGSSIAVADSVSAGTNQQWTPATGTDHGAMVDENPPNGDTDYNASSTVGQRDTYHITAVALSGTTNGIQVNRYLRKTDAGARTTTCVVRSGVTNFDNATAQSPLTTYTYLTAIYEQDPNTSAAWVPANISAAEFGEKVVT